MTKGEYKELLEKQFSQIEYHLYHYKFFDYTILKKAFVYHKRGRTGDTLSYNDVIVGIDTETSKKCKNTINTRHYKNGKIKRETVPVENHIYLWTISIRMFHSNVCTLYGRKPSEFIECINLIHKFLPGEQTIFYCHNLPYDYVFLRKFMYDAWGFPTEQLNIKPHYSLYVKFSNGIIIKDSLALAQRSLDKWTKDLHIEHKKLTGTVDHNKIRNQCDDLEPTLIKYAEYDTLGLVEAIDKTCDMLGKQVFTLPYTATGIVRESVQKVGAENHGHDWFKRVSFDYIQYLKGEKVYHGGYTHANRWLIGEVFKTLVKCYDIASSYPFCLVAYKYPAEKFKPYKNVHKEFILKYADKYAFIFKLILYDYEVSDYKCVMPPISLSKCEKIINPVTDNGRVLKAAYIELYTNEIDLELITKYMSSKTKSICVEVERAHKSYLPRWFTDLVFKYFEDKTRLKTSEDFIAYMLAKIKVNSLYGLCAQHSIKEDLKEDYETGDYHTEERDNEEKYNKFFNNRRSILPYFIGIYCTSYAQRNLFDLCLGCIDEPYLHWIYSDTDSGYSDKWNEEKIKVYNEERIRLLRANGYDGVVHEGRTYYLGILESEGDKDLYTEYVALGSKRYCGRSKKDGELHITVAGVPKIGAKCLKDDINNFKRGFIFDGETTGKKTHAYQFVDAIYIDDKGNETGDSIDLFACDYLLDEVTVENWEDVLNMELNEEYVKEFDESEVYY